MPIYPKYQNIKISKCYLLPPKDSGMNEEGAYSYYLLFFSGMRRISYVLVGLAALASLYFDYGGLGSLLYLILVVRPWLGEYTSAKEIKQWDVFHRACGPDMMRRPVHYRTEVPFDWAKLLRDNYHVILEELHSNDFPLISISDLDEGNRGINRDHQWRALYLIINGYPTKISQSLPRTMALLKQTPLFVAFISNIDGGGRGLAFHRGTSQFAMRYHLGLNVPSDEPQPHLIVMSDVNCTASGQQEGCPGSRNSRIPMCRTLDCMDMYLDRVHHEQDREVHKLTWKTGDDLVFDDMFEHAVFKDNPRERMILFADYVRDDCPYFLNKLMQFSSWFWVANYHERVVNLIKKEKDFDYDPKSWKVVEKEEQEEKEEEREIQKEVEKSGISIGGGVDEQENEEIREVQEDLYPSEL